MAITVTGSNPTQVTVVSETTTTNTTFNAGVPNDRSYVLNDSIVGTINAGAIVRGFGLRLQTTEADGGVAMTNNESILINNLTAALDLTGNGGAVTYTGSGTITNLGGAALFMSNSGSGSASATISDNVRSGNSSAVWIITQNGGVNFTQASGTRIDTGSHNTSAVQLSTDAGAIVATTGGTIWGQFGAGIGANTNSGNVHINMTEGQIGSANQRPYTGIAVNSNATVNDIAITTTNIFSSDFAISARMTNAAAIGDVTITINGTVSSNSFAVETANEGTGRTAITVNGSVVGGQGVTIISGSAIVVNSGAITGIAGRAVVFGDGNDTYNGVGGLVTGQIAGGAGNDTLRSGSGSNNLLGEQGNDILDGGVGNDTMTGHAGDDVYTVDRSDDLISEVGGQGFDRLLAGASYVLASGVSIEAMATLSSGATTAINLTGNEVVNSITGNAGNNVLNGGAGADTLQGLAGSDSYFVDVAGDKILETAGQGTDSVFTAVSYVLASSISAETLRTVNPGVTTAINLTGNNLANIVIGNAGNNAINGGGGADTLHGGFGNDSYYVDNALDKIVETAGRGIDNVNVAVSYTLAAGVSAETLRTINAAATTTMTLIGNEFANIVVGNAGSNTLHGRGGNDKLTGGARADVFVFNTTPNAATNMDTIADFNVAQDTIRLENAIFTALGPSTGVLAAGKFFKGAAAHDADDRIIYNSATGALIYDVNGNAAGGAVQFAKVAIGLALTNADFVIF